MRGRAVVVTGDWAQVGGAMMGRCDGEAGVPEQGLWRAGHWMIFSKAALTRRTPRFW